MKNPEKNPGKDSERTQEITQKELSNSSDWDLPALVLLEKIPGNIQKGLREELRKEFENNARQLENISPFLVSVVFQ